MSEEELWERARESAEAKVGFYVHLTVYLAVNSMLVVLWWVTSTLTDGAVSFPWFLFPLVGWGIGVAAHYVAAFHGSAYLERKTREEFERIRPRGPGDARAPAP